MADIYAALAADESRNDLIFDDVLKALDAKRTPLLLTERRSHVDYFQDRLSRFVRNLIVLRGGMSKAELAGANAALCEAIGRERLILATGRYLGEGFDDARLDTLFLAMPISWKGTLAQYVGRLHRRHDGKTDAPSSTTSTSGYPCWRGWRQSEGPDIRRLATGSNSRSGQRSLASL
jgi:superfamily II DNA or RNA helicase